LALALAGAPGRAGATIGGCLNLRGVIYVEGQATTNGDVDKQQLERVRFSGTDLLNALAELFMITLPRGACIEVTPQDDPTPDTVALVDADGGLIQDLTGVVAVDLDTQTNVFSGSVNNVTLAQSTLTLFRIAVTVTLPAPEDIDFTLEGVAFERLRAGAEDMGTGLNSVRATIKAKVGGGGTAFTFQTFIEGKAALKGSGDFDL
jgi:hypothetical protein